MSITNITYLHSILQNNIFLLNNPLVTRFYFNDFLEVKHFLELLENDNVYVVTFEFVYSWLNYEEDGPIITLAKPILVTKNSNSKLISNFIVNKIQLACDSYYLDYEFNDKLEGPGVLVKYQKINLF